MSPTAPAAGLGSWSAYRSFHLHRRQMPFRRSRKAGLLKPVVIVLGLVGVTSAGLAGCGLGAQSDPQALNPKSVPYGLLGSARSPSTSVPDLVTARVTMFLEGSNERLVPVHREVAWPATISAILGQLAAGPTARESDRGLVSPASAVGPFGVGPCATASSQLTCRCRSRTWTGRTKRSRPLRSCSR